MLTRGYDVYIGKTNDGEIDFLAINVDEKMYFQVAYSVSDSKTEEREFGAYDDVSDNYPKYVLSLDKIDYSKDGIIHKNIIEWLMEN